MVESVGYCIAEHFGALDDPRVERTKRHQLLDIVTIALCGILCGADSWVEIESFGRAKERWLATFLNLPHGIPSHDTFGRVFAALNPDQFEAGFLSWVQAIMPQTQGQVVALDGKTLRRSHDQANGKAALHLVSAWASENRLILGQQATSEHSNEITALPLLLEVLALEGCLVTIDAMGCQTALAGQIRDQQADYLLALKGNQPQLYTEVRELCTDGLASHFQGVVHDHHTTVEKGHGRIETRHCWVISDASWIDWLNETERWPALGSIVLVEAERRIGGQVSREQRYYLSSLTGDAERTSAAVRAHWGIENQVHWVLDVAFREDESRVRVGHAAQNLAVMRRMALNLLRQETSAKMGIAAKRKKAGWDESYLLKVLTK